MTPDRPSRPSAYAPTRKPERRDTLRPCHEQQPAAERRELEDVPDDHRPAQRVPEHQGDPEEVGMITLSDEVRSRRRRSCGSQLIHNTIPAMNVDVPSVTMNGSIPNSTIEPAVDQPDNAPAASATTIASADVPPVIDVQDGDDHRDEHEVRRDRDVVVAGHEREDQGEGDDHLTAWVPKMLTRKLLLSGMCPISDREHEHRHAPTPAATPLVPPRCPARRAGELQTSPDARSCRLPGIVAAA